MKSVTAKIDQRASRSGKSPDREGESEVSFPMTKLLDRAVEAARGLAPEMQDELARMLLQFVGAEQPVIPLTPEERSALEASLAQAERGEFATDEEVLAIWAKRGL
jgi:hypothetical protein